MTYKLTLEYDGSKFSGWQIQNNARTVQGELQRVADELFGAAVDVQGAGRTDAGVHALGQVAHIKVREARRKYTPAHLMAELNEKLPSSIAVPSARLPPQRSMPATTPRRVLISIRSRFAKRPYRRNLRGGSKNRSTSKR